MIYNFPSYFPSIIHIIWKEFSWPQRKQLFCVELTAEVQVRQSACPHLWISLKGLRYNFFSSPWTTQAWGLQCQERRETNYLFSYMQLLCNTRVCIVFKCNYFNLYLAAWPRFLHNDLDFLPWCAIVIQISLGEGRGGGKKENKDHRGEKQMLSLRSGPIFRCAFYGIHESQLWNNGGSKLMIVLPLPNIATTDCF